MGKTSAEELRRTEKLTREASRQASPMFVDPLDQAANIVQKEIRRLERKEAGDLEKENPVLVIPLDATADELREARGRQATRRGKDVFLPHFGAKSQVFPQAFLRSSLFSTCRTIQRSNQKVIDGDTSRVVQNKAVVTFNDLSVLISGHELCQFDRRVYAACLDFYRDRPLARENGDDYIDTTFSALAKKIGSKYSGILHRSILASLLRLSHAQISIRQNLVSRSIPRLLTVSFATGATSASEATELRATDKIHLQIEESLSQLFGFGKWTAIEHTAVGYDGMLGWVANFYATHSKAQLLSVEKLRQISGYESHLRNFKTGLCNALDTLTSKDVPREIRIARYYFANDGHTIGVHRAGWEKK